MDDLLIKTNNAVRDAGAAQKPAGAENPSGLAGLAVTFNDLLQKAGLRIENGLFALADRAGIGAITERGEPVKSTDDYRRQADDGKNQEGVRDRSDANRDEPARVRPTDRHDDSGRDHGAQHRDARGDARDSDHAQSHADQQAANQRGDAAANRDAPAADDRGGEQKSANTDGAADKATATAKNSAGETKTATQQPNGEQAAGTVVTATAAVAKVAVTSDALNALLTGLLADGQAQATNEGPARALEVISATGAENMAATAVENITKTTPVATGQDNGSHDNARGKSQVFFNTDAQAKTMTAGATVHNAEGNGKAAVTPVDSQAEAIAKTTDNVQTQIRPMDMQAASLARMIGADNRAQINVSIDDESQNLMSRPTATLTAGAALAGDSQGRSASGQSASTHAQAANPNPAAAQAQQTQAGPTQAQNAQAAQAQAAAQAGGDAKSLVQAASTSGNGGGTAHAGSGEANAFGNTNSAPGAQQAQQAQQQAAANQPNKSEQPVRNGHAVYEQVSVKIAKAINAGNDRITIQLRPANMGRVEVKMELTHDNRLTAVVTADNKHTLELLQRDARDLQRALADAGLHTGNGDLQFNLRGETGQGTDGDGRSAGKLVGPDDGADAADAAIAAALLPPEGGIYANGRIDIRA